MKKEFPINRIFLWACCFATSSSLLIANSDGTDSEFNKELKAALLYGDDDSDYSPALQYKLGYKYEPSWTTALNGHVRARSEGTVATESDANSENLFAEIEVGTNLELTRAATGPSFDANAPDEGIGMDFGDRDVKERQHYGNIDFSGTLRFETDQNFNNYNLAYGPRLGYVHRDGSTREQAFWALLPKVQLGYSRVEVLHSEKFDSEGIDEDAFWRLDGVADWTFHVGKWMDPEATQWYNGLKLAAKIQYSKGYNLPDGANEADLDEAFYYSGSVYYRFQDGTDMAKWISAVYLTVGDGRVAPQPEEQTQVFLGVVVNFD
jgi:hypothetical protein